MIRLHLLSSTAEVSLCCTGVWGEGKKKVLTAHFFFFTIPIFIGLPRGSRPAEEGGERG